MKFFLLILILNLNCNSPSEESPCSPTSKTFWGMVIANIATKSSSSVCNIKLPNQNSVNNSSTQTPVTQTPPVTTPTTSSTLVPGPRFRWLFNSNYASSTANALTLTSGGTPAPSFDVGIKKEGTESVFLNPGGGAHTGSQTRLTSASVDVGNTFSISVWLNPIPPDAGYTLDLLTILANKSGSAGTSTGFSIFLNTFDNPDQKLILNTGNNSTEINITTTTVAFTYNVWFHLVMTYDRVNGIGRIYKDGVELAVTPNNTIHTDFNTNAILRFGALSTGNNFCYSGRMDDFRIYDIVLTPAQVTAIYNEVL